MSENEIEVPEDYTREELRQDLLCYTSPVLKEDLILTGDVLGRIFGVIGVTVAVHPPVSG